ncbi:MAG: hypothetical protein JRJ00_06780, partial [Deltaproteobacteria bacterium]|nr:hypothetical protein [Deltaproteobacteria bacterium]
MIAKRFLFLMYCIALVCVLIFCFGCAHQPVVTEPPDDIEDRIESLGKKLTDALRLSDIATENLALIEESSIGKGEVSQFGIFATDMLKRILTRNHFSVIDIKGVHWENILDNKPIGTPETDCERKESPQVILLLNVKDYGTKSKIIYVTVTAKRAASNQFVPGLVVEEKFNRFGRIVAWVNDRKQVPMPLGTERNPFKAIDVGIEYLAKEICCPYQELVKKCKKGEYGAKNIDPEAITLVVTSINSSTRRIGRFEKSLMSRLKNYLIRDCGIENAVDISDYALLDKQLTFYEKEGTFKLDFMSSNRERFKPGTVLLIAETFYHEGSKIDTTIRASWMESEAETVLGDIRSVGGTYLPGFASGAYFHWEWEKYFEEEEAEQGPVRNITISFNQTKGSTRLKELMEGELATQGYRVVNKNNKGKKLQIEAELR